MVVGIHVAAGGSCTGEELELGWTFSLFFGGMMMLVVAPIFVENTWDLAHQKDEDLLMHFIGEVLFAGNDPRRQILTTS